MMKFNISSSTKNICYGNHMLLGIVTGTAAPISNYINNPVFQELLLESDYFGAKSDEKIYIGLWDSLGYTDQIEKPNKNGSELNVTIELRNSLAKKWGLEFGDIQMVNSFIYWLTVA